MTTARSTEQTAHLGKMASHAGSPILPMSDGHPNAHARRSSAATESMTPLRVIIADDERPARAFLSSILRNFEDVELVGEAASGTECVELIEQTSPDLALIDLNMPEVDGLGVARLIRKDRLPLVAFVTAFDEFAVPAFE